MRSLLIIVAALGILAASLAGDIHPNQSQTNNRFLFPTDVKYSGISLHVDKALATEIKAETVPASLSGKPGDLWPEHVAFTLVGYPRPRHLEALRGDEFQPKLELLERLISSLEVQTK